MCRAEIIANSSVQEELIDAVEAALPKFQYTLVPMVHGKGRTNRKLGTVTWPELNFLMISYVEDQELDLLRSAIKSIKERFPREGIKLFLIPEIPV